MATTSEATYGNKEDLAVLAPGMYLGLFHGRDDPDEELEDWGFNGPVIGPLTGYHITYMHTARLRFANKEAQQQFFPGDFPGAWYDDWVELEFDSDMLKFQGRWYGDWTIFMHGGKDE